MRPTEQSGPTTKPVSQALPKSSQQPRLGQTEQRAPEPYLSRPPALPPCRGVLEPACVGSRELIVPFLVILQAIIKNYILSTYN